MRIWTIAVAAGLLGGCVNYEPPAPSPQQARAVDVAAPTDVVWQRITGSLFDMGLEVQTADRSGGLLRTGWLRITDTDRGAALMECGTLWGVKLRPNSNQAAWVLVQVLVAEQSENTVRVRVAPQFKLVTNGESPAESNHEWDDCQSTGLLERELLAALDPVAS